MIDYLLPEQLQAIRLPFIFSASLRLSIAFAMSIAYAMSKISVFLSQLSPPLAFDSISSQCICSYWTIALVFPFGSRSRRSLCGNVPALQE